MRCPFADLLCRNGIEECGDLIFDPVGNLLILDELATEFFKFVLICLIDCSSRISESVL